MTTKKRLIILFIKTFVISFAPMLTVILAVYSYASNTIQPPELPQFEIVTTLPSGGYNSNDLYEEQDTGDLPQIIKFEERKPYFFTFLVVGLTEGNNANTIMVASYDANTREANIVSIPRDTIVDFQRNNRKIVAAYQVGRLHGGGHQGGINRLKEEVTTIVGFRPDFYIRIDYEAFESMINSVGGIEMYVPFHKRYDDPLQNLHINISAGFQVLDGRNALHFARYRNGNDPRFTITDYQRIENQQKVISALASKLLTPASLLRIPEFVNIFNTYIHSNLGMGELLWFANQARGIGDLSNLNMHTIPMLGTSGVPYWFELPDEMGIIELVNTTVNPLVRDINTGDTRIVIQ